MNNLEEGETREILLQRATSAGYEVTSRQLVRWHQMGLLPKPKQESLGRGRGTRTIYPAGASIQLLALCSLKQKERRFDYLAWQLWWEGYQVDSTNVREFLDSQWKEWDREIWNLIDHKRGDLSETTRKTLIKSGQARLRNKAVRQARKRVGAEAFGDLALAVLQIATGLYRHSSGAEDLIQKGLDMQERGSASRALPVWLPFGIDFKDLVELSQFMKDQFRSLKLGTVGDRELQEVRDRIRTLERLIAHVRPNIDRTKVRMGLSIIEPNLNDPKSQSYLLRFYLAARRGPFSARVKEFEKILGL